MVCLFEMEQSKRFRKAVRKMKRVTLDMDKLRNLHSGLGQYCLCLGRALEKQNNYDLALNYLIPDEAVNLLGNDAKYEVINWKNRIFKNATACDVWHFTHQEPKYFPGAEKIKKIITVHDLNFLFKYRGLKQRIKTERLQNLLGQMDSIVSISHFTKQMLIEKLNMAEKKITVIYNGCSLIENPTSLKPVNAPAGKFVFTIGIVAEKKNFGVLIPWIEKNKDGLILIIAGSAKSIYAQRLMQLVKQKKLSNRIFFVGEINEEHRSWYYKNCEAFVFPSLSEGFGLPVVEAMSFGKPVFLNRATSLPEIGGEQAFYWENFDTEYMQQIFDNAMSSYNANLEKRKLIQKWASKFSWKNAAQEYLNIYKTL